MTAVDFRLVSPLFLVCNFVESVTQAPTAQEAGEGPSGILELSCTPEHQTCLETIWDLWTKGQPGLVEPWGARKYSIF